jgi:hypothetical protein
LAEKLAQRLNALLLAVKKLGLAALLGHCSAAWERLRLEK